MNIWSGLSDLIFKITVKKVMLFVVVVVSWMFGYALIPDKASEYLIGITPPFLPFGSSFKDVAILAFALTIGLIAYFIHDGCSKLLAWIKKPKPMSFKKAEDIIDNKLKESEQLALYQFCFSHFEYMNQYSSDYAKNKSIIAHFSELKLIVPGWGGVYVLDKTVEKIITDRVREHIK